MPLMANLQADDGTIMFPQASSTGNEQLLLSRASTTLETEHSAQFPAQDLDLGARKARRAMYASHTLR